MAQRVPSQEGVTKAVFVQRLAGCIPTLKRLGVMQVGGCVTANIQKSVIVSSMRYVRSFCAFLSCDVIQHCVRRDQQQRRMVLAQSTTNLLSTNEPDRSLRSVPPLHMQWELAFYVMLGIRRCVGEEDAVGRSSVHLTKEDFLYQRELSFDSSGGSKGDREGDVSALDDGVWYFKAFAPMVFRRLRHLYGIEEHEYMYRYARRL